MTRGLDRGLHPLPEVETQDRADAEGNRKQNNRAKPVRVNQRFYPCEAGGALRGGTRWAAMNAANCS
jgi:hypothetical protein